MASEKKKVVGIYIFDQVEVLDYAGPFEVFATTMDPDGEPLFEVLLIADYQDEHDDDADDDADDAAGGKNDRPVPTQAVVTTIGGMHVLPHTNLAKCPPLDILIVPGGNGSAEERHKPHLLQFLHQQAAKVEVLASVCTGTRILGEAGLLNGKRATSHWTYLEQFQKEYPLVKVEANRRWVQDNPRLYTAAGISAGIDMSLKIVEQVMGTSTAHRTAKEMEYPFPHTNQRPPFE